MNLDEQREHRFTRIFRTNYWNSKESRSGRGSSMKATTAIRTGLQEVIDKFGITSMLDIPCGDFNWVKTLDLSGVEYLGADIVSELIEENILSYEKSGITFKVIDAVKDPIPKVDLIFCRDMLQHLPKEEVTKVLHQFHDSGSKYLMVTSYNNRNKNGGDIQAGGYSPWNLFISPWIIGRVIKYIPEGGHSVNEHDKAMYLLDLRTLWKS